MNKQKVLALALGAMIGLGTIFGGGMAYANQVDKQESSSQSELDAGMCWEDELLAKAGLSKEELKQYNEAIDKIMAIYDNLEGKEINPDILNQLEAEEDKIYQENKSVFDKVDKYFASLPDAPHNQILDQVDGEVDLELIPGEFYDDLVKNKVLSSEEVARLQEAEAKLDGLYANHTGDMGENELLAQEAAIYKEYQAVFDKINAYYDQGQVDIYQEMVDSGDMTWEEAEKMRLADAKADEWLAQINENSKPEEVDRVLDEIDKLYAELGF